MKVEPYLMFDGRADEAIEFYKKALGAEVLMLMRFKDSPDQSMVAPGTQNKVMHATLRIGESVLMCSDGDCRGGKKFDGFSLSVTAGNDAQAERVFAALGDGGKVNMPLTKTFFSSKFGMVQDRVGVNWMVIVQPPNAH